MFTVYRALYKASFQFDTANFDSIHRRCLRSISTAVHAATRRFYNTTTPTAVRVAALWFYSLKEMDDTRALYLNRLLQVTSQGRMDDCHSQRPLHVCGVLVVYQFTRYNSPLDLCELAAEHFAVSSPAKTHLVYVEFQHGLSFAPDLGPVQADPPRLRKVVLHRSVDRPLLVDGQPLSSCWHYGFTTSSFKVAPRSAYRILNLIAPLAIDSKTRRRATAAAQPKLQHSRRSSPCTILIASAFTYPFKPSRPIPIE